MYRNVVYDPGGQSMRLFTWDKTGKRITINASYNPYFYYEDPTGKDGNSLFNTKLTKRTFSTSYERGVETGQYKNRHGERRANTKRVFENLKPDHQFLIDSFWETYDDEDFANHPLKIWFLDIETYSPHEFPKPEEAAHPINIITIYDSIEEKFYSWGTKPYKSQKKDQIYTYCQSERDLLVKFIEFMEKDYPDIITGWNSDFFDIPYIVRRVEKLLGTDELPRLSPVSDLKSPIYSRELPGEFYKNRERFYIKGVSCIDYLDIYKIFTQGLRESYKLDSIAKVELGEQKVDYGNTNLSSLADEDWKTFVEYNIQDVRLLVRLEEKLSFLSLVRMLAYVGLVPLESALGTITVVTGAAVIQARKDGKIVPTFQRDSDHEKYEGAYVSDPQKGFQNHVVSFDANSLYPNTMISLNLSPETKLGWITRVEENKVHITHVSGKEYTLSHSKFAKFLDKEKVAITKAKVLFTQKQRGIFPKIADAYYEKRVKVKKQLTKLKRELSEMDPKHPEYKSMSGDAERLNIKQLTIKILINRIYGYFGNRRATLGDTDITRSITLTGQAVIKQSNKILQKYIQNLMGYTDEEIKEHDPVIYNDTDSVYITISDIIKKLDIPFTNRNGRITKQVKDEVKKIESHLNTKITEWAKKNLNTIDSRFVFKRENICDVGIFLQKKRYVLHILDDEDLPVNKFKYTGVEVVRSTMPAPIKPYVKKIVETMLTTKSQTETNKLLNESYTIFKSLPIEDISFISGLSKYDKYANKCNGFNTCKGMPIHCKAAYSYNKLLEKLKLEHKYETIGAGDKVRYFYVNRPNSYNVNSIGYKYYYPKEFNEIFQPDLELMFEKIIFNMVERFYVSVNWQCRKPGYQLQTDLFELLGM
jgi:DNA polymerase elongation subunit (family B)